jgi:acyl-coenzyme A synthetase/AMP-(fatty) acid ligase
MVIDRTIINRDIDYAGVDYDSLCNLVDRWKTLLISKGCQKGQTLALAILDVTPNHIACIFAAAELGLLLFLINKPITVETVSATKMGQLGPIDITVVDEILKDEAGHAEMFRLYSKQLVLETDVDCVNDIVYSSVTINPSDPFLLSSTSGTTGNAKPVIFTHNDIYKISKQNIDVFMFEKNSTTLHDVSMHHASSLVTGLLPSLMIVDKHFYRSRLKPTSLDISRVIKEYVIPYGVCRMMSIFGESGLRRLVEGLEPYSSQIKKTILINTSGFSIPEYYYDAVKNLNIEIISHYGSVDTGIPLLVNHITKDSEYIPSSVGKPSSDLYEIELIENVLFVSSELWEGKRKVPDLLSLVKENYIIHGREDNRPYNIRHVADQLLDHSFVKLDSGEMVIVLWREEEQFLTVARVLYLFCDHVVSLNKERFTVETKVDMAQVRAYLENHYRSDKE